MGKIYAETLWHESTMMQIGDIPMLSIMHRIKMSDFRAKAFIVGKIFYPSVGKRFPFHLCLSYHPNRKACIADSKEEWRCGNPQYESLLRKSINKYPPCIRQIGLFPE